MRFFSRFSHKLTQFPVAITGLRNSIHHRFRKPLQSIDRNRYQRRRAEQLGGAHKKQKRDSVTQQDLDDATRRAGETDLDENITESWIELMKTWWRKIRRSRN